MFVPQNGGLPIILETIGGALKLINEFSKDEKPSTPQPSQQIIPVEVPRYKGEVENTTQRAHQPININLTLNIYLNGKKLSLSEESDNDNSISAR